MVVVTGRPDGGSGTGRLPRSGTARPVTERCSSAWAPTSRSVGGGGLAGRRASIGAECCLRPLFGLSRAVILPRQAVPAQAHLALTFFLATQSQVSPAEQQSRTPAVWIELDGFGQGCSDSSGRSGSKSARPEFRIGAGGDRGCRHRRPKQVDRLPSAPLADQKGAIVHTRIRLRTPAGP